MRNYSLLVCAAVAFIGLVGCKKSDSTASGGGTTATAAQQVAGSAPKKASQLVGRWVHTTPVDIYGTTGGMAGLEFSDNGKVQVYMGSGGQSMASDYALLDDGRLSLSMEGLTSYVLPSVSGDQLQLKEPDSGKIASFRRLNSGETMVAAMASANQQQQRAVAERNAALPALLSRKDLVLVVNKGTGGPNGGASFIGSMIINGSKDAPPPTALEFAPANGNDYIGRAYYDSNPPRMEPVAGRIGGSPDKPTFSMIFGPGTVDQNGGRGVVDFHVEGSAPNIILKSSVDYGGPRLSEMIIQSNPTIWQQIVGHLKAEGERLNTVKQPVLAMLKDYVVLKGTSQSQLPAERQGFGDQFTLTRNPQNNTWVGQAELINRTTGATDIFPAVAAVGIVNNKPAIQIMSQKRAYLFSEIDIAGGKLGGIWHLPQNPNGQPAELTIVQATDAKGRDALFAASKDALQKLTPDTVFHALVSDQGNQPPSPVAVTLSVSAGGTVSGKADYPLEGCSMKLSGRIVNTPLGPQLLVQYSGGEAGADARGDARQFMDGLQHEAWTLSPAGDPAAGLRLEGMLIANTAQRTAPLSLQLLPYTDKDKTAIAQALGAGMKFRLINPKMGDVVDIIEFASDSSSDMIKGHLTTAGHQINSSPNTTFTGPIKEEMGWAKLVMPILRPIDRTPTYAYTVVATPTDGGMYISAGTYNIGQGLRGPMGRWDAIEVKP